MYSIGIIGTGGVGGYFGGKLAVAARTINTTGNARNASDTRTKVGADVMFLARGKHLDAIRRQGGLILSASGEGEMLCTPALATDSIAALPSLDLVLLCVKSYDLESILAALVRTISSTTRIIPLLNGIDIAERVRSIIHNGIVHPACVYVGTHIEAPGKVVQNGGACEILFGLDPAHPEAVPKDVCTLFDGARIKYRWLGDDPYPEIWKKFIFIAAFGLVTAAYGKTIGEVMESAPLGRTVRAIAAEIHSIARVRNVEIPDDIVEETFSKGNNFPRDAKTSFQRDFEKAGVRDERDLFGGTIIRMGKLFGVPTPETEHVSALLNDNGTTL